MDVPKKAPPDVRQLLESDPHIARNLFGYAFEKTQNKVRMFDVAQEAIARVLEGRGWYRWDPSRKSLLDHLSDVVDTVVANEDRRAYVTREQPMEQGDERKPNPAPSPEHKIDATEELERKQRLASRVMERVADDPIIPRMLKLEQKGVGKASELKDLLGCSVKDIYLARERLAYHRDQVVEEDRKLEQKRMKRQATSS